MQSVFKKTKMKRSYMFHRGNELVPPHIHVGDSVATHSDILITSEGFQELDEIDHVELDGVIYTVDAKATIEDGFVYYVSELDKEAEVVSDDRESLIKAQEEFINFLKKHIRERILRDEEPCENTKKRFFDRFRRL